MARERRVLVVTYPFLPLYDIGVKRVAKLCKYLPDYGWRPVVLTKDWGGETAPEDSQVFPLFREPERFDELAGKIDVVYAPYRTHRNAMTAVHEKLSALATSMPTPLSQLAVGLRKSLSITSPFWGSFPDAYTGWVESATEVALGAVREFGIEAILSLCPPPSAHIVASEVARKTGIPWIAQFDDLFSFHLEKHRPLWRGVARRRHRHWISQAAAVGAITPAMLRYLERTYGKTGEVVMVGFDPEESPSPADSSRPTLPSRSERFRIVYTGSIYPGDQRPELFLAGLELLLSEDAGAEREIEMTFVGTRREAELGEMLTERTARVCRILPRVAAAASLELQRTADVLLLLNLTDPSVRAGTLSYPAKAFEYLAAGRPILAVPSDPGGWGNELLARTGAGFTADDPRGIANCLRDLLGVWRQSGKVAYGGRRDVILEYGQPVQALRLARLLDSVTAGQRTGDTQRVASPTVLAWESTPELATLQHETRANAT